MSTPTFVIFILYICALGTSIILLINDDEATGNMSHLKLRPWAKTALWIISFPIGMIIVAAVCIEYASRPILLLARNAKKTITPYIYQERKDGIEEE